MLVIFSVSVLYFSGSANENFEEPGPGFTKWNQRTLLVEYDESSSDEVTDGQK